MTSQCKNCHVCTYARLIEMFMKLTHGHGHGDCKCPSKKDLESTLASLSYCPLFSDESEYSSDSDSDTETSIAPSDTTSAVSSIISTEAEPYMRDGLTQEEYHDQSTQYDDESEEVPESDNEVPESDNEVPESDNEVPEYYNEDPVYYEDEDPVYEYNDEDATGTDKEPAQEVFKPQTPRNPFESAVPQPRSNMEWIWSPPSTENNYESKWFVDTPDLEAQQNEDEDLSVRKALNPSYNWFIS